MAAVLAAIAVLAVPAAARAASTGPAADPDLDQLTTREQEVLRLIARGYPYKAVARELVISHPDGGDRV